MKLSCLVLLSGLLLSGCDYRAMMPAQTVPVQANAVKEREQITEEFIGMLEEDPELKRLVEKSIHLAVVNNRDPRTNPVRSLEDYYDFLDWSATCMPWDILDEGDESDLYGRISSVVRVWISLCLSLQERVIIIPALNFRSRSHHGAANMLQAGESICPPGRAGTTNTTSWPALMRPSE